MPRVPARLAAYYFAYFAYAGALVPYFALWLAARQFTPAQIAFVLAMPQVARVFAPALWGWLADGWSARHAGARRAIVVFSACAVLAGFAALYAVGSLAGIAAVMLATSVLSAGALPLVEVIALSVLGAGSGRYGPVRLWGSIGFILAVLGVGAWLDSHSPGTILDIVVLLSVLTVIASIGVPAAGITQPARAPARLASVLRRPEVRALFGAGFCMAVAHGTMYAFYSIHLEAEGYSKTLIGALWTLGVVAEVVLFLRLPQLLRRFSLRALLLASFACAVLRFLAIGWGVGSLAVLAAAQLLHAATFGAYHSASIAAVHRMFAGALEARGQALFSSLSYGLGGAVGTLLAGWTWQALGPVPSFAVSAAFAALGGWLVAWKTRT
jgi:PPP family 3-phenylpropionic acid transporter